MTSFHAASSFNAKASLNQWMSAALAAFSFPAWFTAAPSVVFDWAQISASFPCYSITHIPVMLDTAYQGRTTGKAGRETGLMEVSCWTSRAKSDNYAAQLENMRDTVMQTVLATASVVILDYTNAVNPPLPPTATAYKIDILNAQQVATEPDINPDVLRARILIEYAFITRSS